MAGWWLLPKLLIHLLVLLLRGQEEFETKGGSSPEMTLGII